MVLLSAASLCVFLAILCTGPVEIPLREVIDALFGSGNEDSVHRFIVIESRLPMALTALLAGASLSVAGLMMQTTFANPLAGPSVLGISSGASLGVAIVILAASALHLSPISASGSAGAIIGAMAGACAVILLLTFLARVIQGNLTLLIAGIMVSYLASSLISLLNIFAPADSVKQFTVWGLGSFSATPLPSFYIFAPASLLLIMLSFLFGKPLNALLAGERYAANMGYSIRRIRSALLFIAGMLTAVVTAFCGPIGFIGLVVPHLGRLIFRTSNHFILIPASLLCGALTALACALLSVIPLTNTIIPVNAITPLFGVPVIIYLLIKRDRLPYFN